MNVDFTNVGIFTMYIHCDEIFMFNDDHAMVYCRDRNRLEEWREFDCYGNVISFKDSNGVERLYEYDSNNNPICVHSDGGSWHPIDELYIYWENDNDHKVIKHMDWL